VYKTGNVRINVILSRVYVSFVAVEKYAECVFVALVIQHAKRIVLSSVTFPALPYFSTYLIHGIIFGKKK
jgi:hypothetical protein